MIPKASSDLIPIKSQILEKLHLYAQANPIYYNSYEMELLDIPCIVYEGDINSYWINSIKHDVSNQPFYPTWILSAYAVAAESKNQGAVQIIDIGSGDGRIAYCGKILGLESYGIEIDESLVQLQQQIAKKTGISFGIKNNDANEFDYQVLGLTKPVFFIGGLPEMGEMLAKSIIKKIFSYEDIKNETMFVFMGSFQLKQFSRSTEKWGWGFVIDESGLDVKKVLVLPTSWTMDQQKDTPYVFTTLMGP